MKPKIKQIHLKIGLMYICRYGCSIKLQRLSESVLIAEGGISLELLTILSAINSEIEYMRTRVDRTSIEELRKYLIVYKTILKR